jgi:transcriptional regulator of acetoin/glycerol metabolism
MCRCSSDLIVRLALGSHGWRDVKLRQTIASYPEVRDTQPSLRMTPPAAEEAETALILLVQSDRPAAGSMRLVIQDRDRVVIGRGQPRRIVHSHGETRYFIDDDWISAHHAEIVRESEGWVVHDLGSRNGCLVNGQRVERAVLSGGEELTLGHTLFRFTRGQGVEIPSTSMDVCTYHPALSRALVRLHRLAPTSVPIMLWGETGTGKEVLARALHVASGRTGAFVALNCGALTPSLVEAELFGFRKGSFTGAVEDRAGIIRAAHGGTLLLDEVAELAPSAQASLLRVLQECEVVPIGGTRPVQIDVRVVTASHQRLDQRVEQGLFREDLLARLRGFDVAIPSLRERRDDFGLICASVLRCIVRDRVDTVRFSMNALQTLSTYAWPHNIRELRKALEMATALALDGEIHREHLPDHIREGSEPKPRPQRTLSMQDTALRERLIASLTQNRGNLAAVARAEGKAVVQIRRWLTRCQLDPNEFR